MCDQDTKDKIDTELGKIEEAVGEITELTEIEVPFPPDNPPPLPDPPVPVPPPVVWDVTERIGMVYVGDKDVPIRFAQKYGTRGLTGMLTIKQVAIMRDYPPFGKEENPAYDRYKIPEGVMVYVYCPSKSNYHKKLGKYSTPGPGTMHLWELVAGQPCLRSKELLPKDAGESPKQHKKTRLTYQFSGLVTRRQIYIPVFLCDTLVPEIVPKDQRDALEFWR